MGIIWEEGNQEIFDSQNSYLQVTKSREIYTQKDNLICFNITRVDQGTIKINTYSSSSAAMIGSFLALLWINSGHGNNQFF